MPSEDLPVTGSAWDLPAAPDERRNAVHWAYRILLLREPESDESVAHLARKVGSARKLRDLLLKCTEARTQPGFPILPSMNGTEPPQQVEVHAAPEDEERLFRRVQSVWHALGKEQPHWSVITDDAFRSENIGATRDDFYASGESNIATLRCTLERNGIDPATLQTCLDFGCGVGRLSAALARDFGHVLAVDFSASHLAIAREAFEKLGLPNVTPRLIEQLQDIDVLPDVDLLVSLIVLQHNPPPVMAALLARLLGKLNPGGVAVIQLPTYLPGGYRFRIAEYAPAKDEIEMHALPQREVFAIACAAAVDVLEVLEDTWTGYPVGSRSNTFVFQRPR
ncbi:MAG TPA: class I SAM-dependent methyltransferase [Usitatibacter sp.]|nr:class I SAM-dependent methyltransferase [Usitatibacter sp.]